MSTNPKETAPLIIPKAKPGGSEDLYLHAALTGVMESRFQIPQPSPSNAKNSMRWVVSGESIQVQGQTIRRGMVYTGTRNDIQEPSLLDPSLRATQSIAYPISYWPSYATMEPGSRFRYLEWLSNGAMQPVDIGYVFVYFYGLERRLLVDGGAESTENTGLLAEIERLLSVYGENGSFRRYATSLLEFCRNSTIKQVDLTDPVCGVSTTYEVPFRLRLALGGLARAERKLPSKWALQWSLCDPLISSRTPVQRCPQEFERAFEFVYQARYDDGFLLPQTKTMLKLGYQAASAGLTGVKIELNCGDVPDILAVASPRKKLQSVVDEATAMIEPYSRFLGRNEGKKDTLEAWLMLPPVLWPTELQEQIAALKLTKVAQSEAITLANLLSCFGHVDSPTAGLTTSLVQALENISVGFEPDVLAGARRPIGDDFVVLFTLSESKPPDRSSTFYKTASLDVSLCACFALADGEACDRELQLVDDRIASLSQLSPDQRSRLRAQYRLQVRKPASLTALKNKVRELSEDQRHELALGLSSMANADGIVSPEEVRFMEQLYRSLQLDPKLVYTHLYGGETDRTSSKMTESKASVGQLHVGLVLDQGRIEKLQQETAQVSALLSSVFLEEEREPIQSTEPVLPVLAESSSSSAVQLLPGLGKEQSEFLLLLLSRAQWTRLELEDAASDMQIMLDGTLERINEASLDALDEMLIEGDDPVFVQQTLLEISEK